MKQEVRNRTECSGTAASTYVLCPHIYMYVSLFIERTQCPNRRQRSERCLNSARVHRSCSELVRRCQGCRGRRGTKAQRSLGTRDDNIRTGEQGNKCGFLYCKDRSTGATLKQCTYQISRSFTTSACKTFQNIEE